MAFFLLRWALLAVALGITAWLLPGVHIGSFWVLALASLVLGFVNAVVKPVLFVLTLPITILTLGIFYLFVNAAVFGLAALLVPGFVVDSLGWAVLAALVFSVISWIIGSLVP